MNTNYETIFRPNRCLPLFRQVTTPRQNPGFPTPTFPGADLSRCLLEEMGLGSAERQIKQRA